MHCMFALIMHSHLTVFPCHEPDTDFLHRSTMTLTELERTAALGTAGGASVQDRVGSAVKNGKAQALRDRCQVTISPDNEVGTGRPLAQITPMTSPPPFRCVHHQLDSPPCVTPRRHSASTLRQCMRTSASQERLPNHLKNVKCRRSCWRFSAIDAT